MASTLERAVLPGLSRRLRKGILVAHPDDEILWCGGEMIADRDSDWHIVSLCRGDDPDRAPRFRRMLMSLSATGTMGYVNDGPEQDPLPIAEVADALESLLTQTDFDAVYTHGPCGEYTRHRRHEEVCRAVVDLWRRGVLNTPSLRMFAYDDDGGRRLPAPDRTAPVRQRLSEAVFNRKHALITEIYGFATESWEARAAPREEAFHEFRAAQEAVEWIRTLNGCAGGLRRYPV